MLTWKGPLLVKTENNTFQTPSDHRSDKFHSVSLDVRAGKNMAKEKHHIYLHLFHSILNYTTLL